MKRYRFFLLLLCAALLLTPTPIAAEQNTPTPGSELRQEPTPTPPFGTGLGYDDAQRAKREEMHARILREAGARGIYVADANDLSLCYFSRREHLQFPPGSTTKIMTALLTIENVPLDEVVTTPREATLLGGTNTMLGLYPDEPMRTEDLLYGLMLVSGNDCAITLAYRMDGSQQAFAERMNARALSLGMMNTDFTNPAGRNVGQNLTSPYDMALLTQEALKNETFRRIVGTAEYTIPTNEMRNKPLPIRNSNRLVSDTPGRGFYYADAIGVKTGATALGTCLVTAAKREDVTVICVQFGMQGEDNEMKRQELFGRSVQIFDYVFDYEYVYADAATVLGDYTATVECSGADPDDPEGGMLTVYADTRDAVAYRPVMEIDRLKTGDTAFDVTMDVHAAAPVRKGDLLGTATFSLGGREWYTLPVYASRDVALPPTPAPTEAPTSAPITGSIVEPAVEPTAEPAADAAPAGSGPSAWVWILPAAAVVAVVAVFLWKRKKK
jgi:D-alanyl-D-alanine carboxypeptidase